MLIKLEQVHIDSGIGNNCTDCPMALSINAVLWPEFFAEVHYIGDSGYVTLKQRGKYQLNANRFDKQVFQCELPSSCVTFAKNFDFVSFSAQRMPSVFQSFAFELPILPEFCRVA